MRAFAGLVEKKHKRMHAMKLARLPRSCSQSFTLAKARYRDDRIQRLSRTRTTRRDGTRLA